METLTPFKKICMTIGEIPNSYIDSMSYYECLVWLCNYIEKTVIPAINENAEQGNELISKFNELKIFVDNYFSNLNVQNEINTKLDEMSESGELGQIINVQLLSNRTFFYNTVEEMKNSSIIQNGDLVITKGFYSINDGGSAKYNVVNTLNEANEMDIISLQNNLFAILIADNEVSVKQFGAKGNNTDDDLQKLQRAVDYGSINKLNVYIPAGTYLISGQLLYDSNSVIRGENKDVTIIKTMDGTDLVYHTLVGRNAQSINARLAREDSRPSISQGYPKTSEVCASYIHDIKISDLTIDGNWQNRDLVNWSKYYNNIEREPGSSLELQRVYNAIVENCLIINGPQHNLSTDAGDDCFNEGVDYVSKYPSYDIIIKNVESNNQRYDDGITTHNSFNVLIDSCYVHVDNNVNGTYSTAISNGFEIDDGSHDIKVINCVSKYNFSGYQAKGHSNTPSAYNILFENCYAEACHMAMTISSNHNASSWQDVDLFCKDIVIKNFVSKYMYDWSNISSWTGRGYETLIDSANNVTIDGWTTIFGNPSDVQNIASGDRSSCFENVNTNYFVNFQNIKIYNSQNDRANYPLFNVRGSSRNYTFKDIYCQGWSSYAMIDYSNNSNDGYCVCDNIFLQKREEGDSIINVGSDNLGTRTNLFLIQ